MGWIRVTQLGIFTGKVRNMWAVLQEKFESEDMAQEHTSTINHMKELWRKWRCQMFQIHVKNRSIGEAIKSVPENMDKYDWEWLVRVHYHSDNYKKVGSQNAENRSAVKMPQRTGSKPFRQIKYDMLKQAEQVNKELLGRLESVEA